MNSPASPALDDRGIPVEAGAPSLIPSDETPPASSFATSLSQVKRHLQDQRRKTGNQLGSPMALGTGKGDGASHNEPSRFDVWVESRFGSYGDDRSGVDRNGHFNVFYIGADYVVTPRFLIGALVQFDDMRERSQSNQTDIEGSGWMAGPYATFKLSDNLFLQARAAWGRSDNKVSPFMTYVDEFESERWLARGTLQGHWAYGSWIFTPAATVGYIEDSAEAYVDSLGVSIPGVTSSLGQARVGPEIAYRTMHPDGGFIEPRLKLEGIWNFAADNTAGLLGDTLDRTEGLRARVELGLRMRSASGLMLDIAAAYDGIGSEYYDAVTGRVMVRVPID